MTSYVDRKDECLVSRLAFSFACWGLILPIIFAVPAIILGHFGKARDRISQSKTKTAAIALAIGYFDAVILAVLLYLYCTIPHGLSIHK